MMDTIKRHMAELGFFSVAAYRLWSLRNGFGKALDKSEADLAAELAYFRRQQERPPLPPGADPDHSLERAEVMQRILAGEPVGRVLSELQSRVRKLYDALANQPDARPALSRLVLHAEKYTCFFRPRPALRHLGGSIHNTPLAALAQLARRYRDWLRPVEDWRPPTPLSRKYRAIRQFLSLARYLLAKYPVPRCLASAWFLGDTPEAREYQRWYMHIASGKNIRKAGIPTRITKRVAHLFQRENGLHHRPILSLRRVQMMALGAHVRLADAVAWSKIGSGLQSDEEFWESVMCFFVNNYPMLALNYVDPIVDYIRHMKFEPERIQQDDGSIIEGPPPHPEYTMKGRGADKLIRQVDEWHAGLSGLEHLPLRQWESTGIRPFRYEEVDDEVNRRVEWSISELVTSAQLAVEGRVMHHCVGSYTERCESRKTSIWSMRVVDLEAEEPEPMHVLTIAVDPQHRAVTESRGKCNARPNERIRRTRKRRISELYRHFLIESPRIQALWMAEAGLSHR